MMYRANNRWRMKEITLTQRLAVAVPITFDISALGLNRQGGTRANGTYRFMSGSGG